MRLVIKYTKEERVKYISHLDFLRLVQMLSLMISEPPLFTNGSKDKREPS
jgi:uncharacterized protein (DUF2344 family)